MKTPWQLTIRIRVSALINEPNITMRRQLAITWDIATPLEELNKTCQQAAHSQPNGRLQPPKSSFSSYKPFCADFLWISRRLTKPIYTPFCVDVMWLSERLTKPIYTPFCVDVLWLSERLTKPIHPYSLFAINACKCSAVNNLQNYNFKSYWNVEQEVSCTKVYCKREVSGVYIVLQM